MEDITISTDRFKIVDPNKDFHLNSLETDFTGGMKKVEAIEMMVGNTLDLRPLQDRLYAHGRYALLIIFQAMDAAGKDSTINHVLSGINPQGCLVKSFKHPTTKELSHDYLWRSTNNLPERGMIGVFNRSYYEEVLITRVHPEIILNQRLPGIKKVDDIDKEFWKERYQQINNYERRLTMNGIKVLKFFLHVGKKEQAKRFLKRVNRPDKHWKFSPSDLKERAYWDDYQDAYSKCIQKTATKNAPWYVVPADNKWYTRAVVSEVLANTLRRMNPVYPAVNEATKAYLAEAKQILEAELKENGN